MNSSLRRRLFIWLSVAIILMSGTMAALSFALSWSDASEVEDAQLRQVLHQISFSAPVRIQMEMEILLQFEM